MRGTIKKKTDKGFGFITPEDESKDIFFHLSKLQNVTFDDLNEGDEVEFEAVDTDRGLTAVRISVV